MTNSRPARSHMFSTRVRSNNDQAAKEITIITRNEQKQAATAAANAPASVGNAQVAIPKTAADVPGPEPGSAMTSAYVQSVASLAYLRGWPLVNAANAPSRLPTAPYEGGMKCRS